MTQEENKTSVIEDPTKKGGPGAFVEKDKKALVSLIEDWASLRGPEEQKSAGAGVFEESFGGLKEQASKRKKLDPNTKRARQAMGQAIKDKNLGELVRLVQVEGCAIDVVLGSSAIGTLALVECIESGFFEGFSYLKSRGAPTEWITEVAGIKILPGKTASGDTVELTEWAKKEQGYMNVYNASVYTLIDLARLKGEQKFIEAMWDTVDEFDRNSVARNCTRQDLYVWLVDKGYDKFIAPEGKTHLFVDAFRSYIKEIKVGETDWKKLRPLVSTYNKLLGEVDSEGKSCVWIDLLKEDSVDLLLHISKKGLLPTEGSVIRLDPQKLYRRGLERLVPMAHDKKDMQEKLIEYSLEDLICLTTGAVKETNMLKTVLRSPESRARIEASKEACWALTGNLKASEFKACKQLGLNMDIMRDELGGNPLHRAVERWSWASHNAEKEIWALSSLHPEWALQKNLSGQVPSDRIGDPSLKEALELKFSQAVLKSAVGSLNRGKRTKPMRV